MGKEETTSKDNDDEMPYVFARIDNVPKEDQPPQMLKAKGHHEGELPTSQEDVLNRDKGTRKSADPRDINFPEPTDWLRVDDPEDDNLFDRFKDSDYFHKVDDNGYEAKYRAEGIAVKIDRREGEIEYSGNFLENQGAVEEFVYSIVGELSDVSEQFRDKIFRGMLPEENFPTSYAGNKRSESGAAIPVGNRNAAEELAEDHEIELVYRNGVAHVKGSENQIREYARELEDFVREVSTDIEVTGYNSKRESALNP